MATHDRLVQQIRAGLIFSPKDLTMRHPPDPATTGTAAPKATQAKQHLDDRLDEALEETFPASDPIAVHDPRDDTGAEAAADPARKGS